MVRDELAVYLVLTPEFGGTRFGPFEGLEVRLGSDKERCNIVLSEALGVAKEHCKLIRQADGSMLIAPTERTAAIFLWKGDARRPIQIQTSTAVRPADSFALVTAEGPRFIIELAPLPPEILAKRQKNPRGVRGLSGDKFAKEGWRMFMARLFTVGPVALVTRVWYMIQSGAIFQPRILITGAIMLFGYLSAAGGSCAAFKFRHDAVKTGESLDECKQNLAYADDLKNQGVENLRFHQLVAQVTGISQMGAALEKETALADKVKERAREVAVDGADGYDWLYEDGRSVNEFATLRERIDKSEEIDPTSKRLLPFVAATPQRLVGDFGRMKDSADADACTRGPLRLTYRQARSLGLANVQLDAYVASDAATLDGDEAQRASLLAGTATAAGETPPATAPASEVAVITQGVDSCVFASGDDDRMLIGKLMNVINTQAGKAADNVPTLDRDVAGPARIAKIFAADVARNSYVDKKVLFNFTRGVKNGLADRSGDQWIMERTADVIARSVVLPCRGVLSSDKDKMEKVFGTLPQPVACLVLMYRLQNQ